MSLNQELTKGSSLILILKMLEKEPMYGYQMIKTIDQKSNNLFQWKEGSLYPILISMEKRELIKSYWKEDKRRRKYYEITKKGLMEIRKLEKEWIIFSNSMNSLLGGTL
ncbi:PadR family transcriptional regulator [Alkalibaculum sp. M08DMB]|uniref:PadR family transcriptional regulator n=1 Tax=Alkalibaculum sporogenes TaxID=2655001 RepID=A0A6A7K412_9FIRM|nr:PadR family transcriptional regulator [Alkalibaculum sporogenes]MPW24202.1 PadR family transcriptional regulator [Alkalibaculum sporogenes]